MNSKPVIEKISPLAALPGAEVRLMGRGFTEDGVRPIVTFGNLTGHVVSCSEDFLVVNVPSNAHQGDVKVVRGGEESDPIRLTLAAHLAGNLHPVANPAIDREGNIYATFSGSRGQKVPTSVYKISNGVMTPYLSDLTNPTGMAFNSKGEMFISSRFDGTVYRVLSSSSIETYVKGMGVATGIVFDRDDNLFVGDRSGTIFKIDPQRKTFVFATMEASISAYHLAMSPEGDLFMTGPTIGCLDVVYRISPQGNVERYFSGLGRPQGMSFDRKGNLLVAASYAGQKGVVRITSDRTASIWIAGAGIVGLAFFPAHPNDLILATLDSLYKLNCALIGHPLRN